MLNSCFLELLIKIWRAGINSLRTVMGSNPQQGQRGTGSFAFQWIFGLGKDTDFRKSSSGICTELQDGCAEGFWESQKLPLPAQCLLQSRTCSDNSSDFPLLIYFYLCKWK